MKKLLVILALLAGLNARAINVPHSTTNTATPNESVSTQLPLWLTNQAGTRIGQASMDADGNLRVTLGSSGGAAQAVSVISSVALSVTVTSIANGVSITVNNLGILTATASNFSKFAMVPGTATAQYVTINASTYVYICNPGGVDIVADWCSTPATPADLSNTGAVRISAGQCYAQYFGHGLVFGFPYLVYSNPNYTTPYAAVDN